MIVQNASYDKSTDLTFTVSKDNYFNALDILTNISDISAKMFLVMKIL